VKEEFKNEVSEKKKLTRILGNKKFLKSNKKYS
jgi:hypothetical protein